MSVSTGAILPQRGDQGLPQKLHVSGSACKGEQHRCEIRLNQAPRVSHLLCTHAAINEGRPSHHLPVGQERRRLGVRELSGKVPPGQEVRRPTRPVSYHVHRCWLLLFVLIGYLHRLSSWWAFSWHIVQPGACRLTCTEQRGASCSRVLVCRVWVPRPC